jgi:hypothetical protein
VQIALNGASCLPMRIECLSSRPFSIARHRTAITSHFEVAFVIRKQYGAVKGCEGLAAASKAASRRKG